MLYQHRLSVSEVMRSLNTRTVVLPLEPVSSAAVQTNITQRPYPGLRVLSASLGGVRHGTVAPKTISTNLR